MTNLYSLYEDISENDKNLISESLKSILNNFQNKNQFYVSEFVVVSRTRFFKSISNNGEFLLLQSTSRIINSYEHILRLLHKAKLYLEFVKCLRLNGYDLNNNKKCEEEIIKFINFLESKKIKYYYHVRERLVQLMISSIKEGDHSICDKSKKNKLEIQHTFDSYDNISVKNSDTNDDFTLSKECKTKEHMDKYEGKYINEKTIIEPFDEIEEYGDYLYNILNQIDNKSWKDKKYAEYLKMISLSDSIINDECDKSPTSDNGSLINTSTLTNNTILLPKYLENIRNSIYDHQTKLKKEVKSMIQYAVNDDIKMPLFKTGKVNNEMLPSPDYEKYWSNTKSDFPSKLGTAFIHDVVLKFFNLNNNNNIGIINSHSNNYNCNSRNNYNNKTHENTSNSYPINYYDIFKFFLKGINSEKNEKDEIHLFLKQLLNNTKQKKSVYTSWKEPKDVLFNADDKYDYSLLPLHIYNNSVEICKELLKYAICNNDLVLTLKIVDTFLIIAIHENSLKDIINFLNTIAEYIIIPYLKCEIKNSNIIASEKERNCYNEVGLKNYEIEKKDENKINNTENCSNYTYLNKLICKIPFHEYESLKLIELLSLQYPMFLKINDKYQRCLKNVPKPCEYYSNTLPTYGSYIFQVVVSFEIDNSIKVLDELGSKCKILFQLTDECNNEDQVSNDPSKDINKRDEHNFLEIDFQQNYMYTKFIKSKTAMNATKEKQPIDKKIYDKSNKRTHMRYYNDYNTCKNNSVNNDPTTTNNHTTVNDKDKIKSNEKNKLINVYDVRNMNTIVFDILIDQGCYINECNTGDFQNYHGKIVIYSNGKHLLSTNIKKNNSFFDNDELSSNNNIKLKVFTSRSCNFNFSKNSYWSSAFVDELVTRKLIPEINKNFLLKNPVNIIELYNKVSTSLNRYLYRFCNWDNKEYKKIVETETAHTLYSNIDICTFEKLVKFSENNNKILKILMKLTKNSGMETYTLNDSKDKNQCSMMSQENNAFIKYREHIYEWNLISDSHICTLSILKLYLKNNLDVQNKSRIENNENFDSLSERLIKLMLKIVKLKSPFIHKECFYVNKNYEIEELDLNGNLWLLRRSVFQILLQADKTILSNIFMRIHVETILNLLKFFSDNNNLDSYMILKLLKSLERKGVLEIIMKRMLSSPIERDSESNNKYIDTNVTDCYLKSQNTISGICSSSSSNSNLYNTSLDNFNEVYMSNNTYEKRKKRKYSEENKHEIERYEKRKKYIKSRIIDTTHFGVFFKELISLIDRQTDNAINAPVVQHSDENDFLMENNLRDVINKLCIFYEHESQNEIYLNNTYFDICIKIINEVKQKRNHVSSASEVASIFLRNIILMLTRYILTISSECESSKSFLYQPVIPFYNLHNEILKIKKKEKSSTHLEGSHSKEETCNEVIQENFKKLPTSKNEFYRELTNDYEEVSNYSIINGSYIRPNYLIDNENGQLLNFNNCQRKEKSWVPIISSQNQSSLEDLILQSDDSGSYAYRKYNKSSENVPSNLRSINDVVEYENGKMQNGLLISKSSSTILSDYDFSSDECEEFYFRKNLLNCIESDNELLPNFKNKLNETLYKLSKKKKYAKNASKLKKLKMKIKKYKINSKKLKFIFSLLEEIIKIMLGVGLRILYNISYHFLYEKNGMHKFIYIFGSKVIKNSINEKNPFLQLCESIIKPKSLTLLQACNFVISGMVPCLGYITTLFNDKEIKKYCYVNELNNYLSLKMALNVWPLLLKITLQCLLTSRHLSYEMSVHKDNLHPIAECSISITSLATHFLTFFTIMTDNLSKYEIYYNMKKNAKMSTYKIPLILINSAKYIRATSKKSKYYDFEKAIRTILLQLTDCSVCDYENYVFNHYVIPQSISSFLSATKVANDKILIDSLSNKLKTNSPDGNTKGDNGNIVLSGSNLLESEFSGSPKLTFENANTRYSYKKTGKINSSNDKINIRYKKNIEFLNTLMMNDKDAIKHIKAYYRVFHTNFERAQVAFIAVFLYLIGYDHSLASENLANLANDDIGRSNNALSNENLEHKKLSIACNLARQGVIDLISKSQKQIQKKNHEFHSSSKIKLSDKNQNDENFDFFELDNKTSDENEAKDFSNSDFKTTLNEKQNNTYTGNKNSDKQIDFFLNKNDSATILSCDIEKDDFISCNFSKEEINYLNDKLPSAEKCVYKSNEFISVDLIKKKREKQIDKIIKKCEWIINTYPYGLCSIPIDLNFSNDMDEHFVSMRRNSYDIPITIRKQYSDNNIYKMAHEAATMPTFNSCLKEKIVSMSYLDQLIANQNTFDKLESMQFITENIFGKTTKNLYLLKRLLKTYKRNSNVKESNNSSIKYDKNFLDNDKQLNGYLCDNKNTKFSISFPSCDSVNYYNDELNYCINYNFSEKHHDSHSNNSLILKDIDNNKINNRHNGELWLNSKTLRNYISHQNNEVEELYSNLINYKSDCLFLSLKSFDDNDHMIRNMYSNVNRNNSIDSIAKYTRSIFDCDENLSDHHIYEINNKPNGINKLHKDTEMNKQEFLHDYQEYMKNQDFINKKRSFPSFYFIKNKCHQTGSKEVAVNSAFDTSIGSKDLVQLKEILDFLIDGPDLETVLNMIRIEQLSYLCRYLTSRSLKSMLCAGIFGDIKNPIANVSKKNKFSNKRSQKGYNSNSDDIKKKKKNSFNGKNMDYNNQYKPNEKIQNEFLISNSSRKEKSVSVKKNNKYHILLESEKNNLFIDQRKFNYLELNQKYYKNDKRKINIYEQWKQKSTKSMKWPVILDLLVPTSSRGTFNDSNKINPNVEPSLFSIQNYGWMLLKLLHIIIIKFRNTTPLKHVINQMNNNNGSNTGSNSNNEALMDQFSSCYWFTQPIEYALSYTLTDITKGICIWYLRSNRKMIMNSSTFSQIIKNSMNTLWIESILRLIALQICLRVKPLNDSRYVVPFLYHMITICQPLIREVRITSDYMNHNSLRMGNKKLFYMDENNSIFKVKCAYCHKPINRKIKSRNAKISHFSKNFKNIRKESSVEIISAKKTDNTTNEAKKKTLDIKGYIHSERTQKKQKKNIPKIVKIKNFNSLEHENEVALDNVITGIVIYHEIIDEKKPINKMKIVQNLKGFIIKKEYLCKNQYWALCIQQYKNSSLYTLPLRNLNKYIKHTNQSNFTDVNINNSCYWSISGDPVYNIYGNAKSLSDVELEVCINNNYNHSARSLLKKNNYELEFSVNKNPNDLVNIWVKRKSVIINKELIEYSNSNAISTMLESPQKENKKGSINNKLNNRYNKKVDKLNNSNKNYKLKNIENINQERYSSEHFCECRKYSLDKKFSDYNNDYDSFSGTQSDSCNKETNNSDDTDNLNYKKLKFISWNLIKTVLWGISVSGVDGEIDSTHQVISEDVTKHLKKKMYHISDEIDEECSYKKNYNEYKSKFQSFQRKNLIESVLKMIMSVLIKLCNIIKIYNILTKNIKGPIYVTVNNTKINKNQIKDCEKMITDFIHDLIKCVKNSSITAATLLKHFLLGHDSLIHRFKKLNKIDVSCDLYRLITECIKKAPEDYDGITCFFNKYFDKNILNNYNSNKKNYSLSQEKGIGYDWDNLVKANNCNLNYNHDNVSSKECIKYNSAIRSKKKNRKMSNFFFKYCDSSIKKDYSPSNIHGFFLLKCLPPIKMFPKQIIVQETKKLFYSEIRYIFESYETLTHEKGAKQIINMVEMRQNNEFHINSNLKDNIIPNDYQMEAYIKNDETNLQCNSVSDILGLIPRISYKNHPFGELPQSEFFMSSRTSSDFEVNMERRVLRVLRGLNLGGVVLCLAPLTFPALNVEQNEINDIINFRIQTKGRFGVTVAPAECVLSNVSEVFDRNDVVGFKTSTCPQFRHDVFAANVKYEVGDLLSVKFNVEDQQNQKCLRTELMVSGDSIGSVLEVLFESDSQIEFEKRMNLIFIFQDPMTIVYEGPTFTMEYVDPNTKNSNNSINSEKDLDEAYVNEFYSFSGNDKKGFKKQLKKMKLKKKEFYESIKLYQSILASDSEILKDLKLEVIIRMNSNLSNIIPYLQNKLSHSLFSEEHPHVDSTQSPNQEFASLDNLLQERKVDDEIDGFFENTNLTEYDNGYVTGKKEDENSDLPDEKPQSDNNINFESIDAQCNKSDDSNDNIHYNIRYNSYHSGRCSNNDDYPKKSYKNLSSKGKIMKEKCDRHARLHQHSLLNICKYNEYKNSDNINKSIREVLSIICIFGLNINEKPKENNENQRFDTKKGSFLDELPWLSSTSDLKNSVAYSLDKKSIELFFCNLIDIICSNIVLSAIFSFITHKMHTNYFEENNSKDKHNSSSSKFIKREKTKFKNLNSTDSQNFPDTENVVYKKNNSSSTNTINTNNKSSRCLNNSVSSANANSINCNSLMNYIFIEEGGSLEENEVNEVHKLADNSSNKEKPIYNNSNDSKQNFKNSLFGDKMYKCSFFEYTMCFLGTKAIMCCYNLLRILLEMNPDGSYEPSETVYKSFKKLLNFIKLFFFIDFGISNILIKYFAEKNCIDMDLSFISNDNENAKNGNSSFVNDFIRNKPQYNTEFLSQESKNFSMGNKDDANFSAFYATNGTNFDCANRQNEYINVLEIANICGLPNNFLKYFNTPIPKIKNKKVINQNDTFDLWIYIMNLLFCFNNQDTYSLTFPDAIYKSNENSIINTLFDFEYTNSHFSNIIIRKIAKYNSSWSLKKYLIDINCIMALLLPKLFMDDLKTSLTKINENNAQKENNQMYTDSYCDKSDSINLRNTAKCDRKVKEKSEYFAISTRKHLESPSDEVGITYDHINGVKESRNYFHNSNIEENKSLNKENFDEANNKYMVLWNNKHNAPNKGEKIHELLWSNVDCEKKKEIDLNDNSIRFKKINRNNKISIMGPLCTRELRNKEEILNIFSIVYLFRICVYFLSRSNDFRKEDYWQNFQGQLKNSKIKENTYKLLNEKSSSSLLYGWQRVFYQCVTTWEDKKLVEQLLLIIQSEMLYHLMGSIAQTMSQKKVSVEQFYAISPSVHVAHWMLDTFVRHPLCPSKIRSNCITPLTVTSLFGLIMNGNRLPIFLGIDACRLVYWACIVPMWQNRNVQKKYKNLSDIDMLVQFDALTESSEDGNSRYDTLNNVKTKKKTEKYKNTASKFKRVKCNYYSFLKYLFQCIDICGSSVFNQIMSLINENNGKVNNANKVDANYNNNNGSNNNNTSNNTNTNSANNNTNTNGNNNSNSPSINNNRNSNNVIRNNNDYVNNIIDNLNNNINDILNCIQNSNNNLVLNNNFNGVVNSVSDETIYNLNVTNRNDPNISSNMANNNTLRETGDTTNNCETNNCETNNCETNNSSSNSLNRNTSSVNGKNESKILYNYSNYDIPETKEQNMYNSIKVNASLLIHYFACAACYIKKIDKYNEMSYNKGNMHANFKLYCLYLFVVDHVSKIYSKYVKKSNMKNCIKDDYANEVSNISNEEKAEKNLKLQTIYDYMGKGNAKNTSLSNQNESKNLSKICDKDSLLLLCGSNVNKSRKHILDEQYEGHYPETFVDYVLKLQKQVAANVIIDINDKIHHISSSNSDSIKLKIKDIFSLPTNNKKNSLHKDYDMDSTYNKDNHIDTVKCSSISLNDYDVVRRIQNLNKNKKDVIKNVSKKVFKRPNIIFSADTNFNYVLQEMKFSKTHEFLYCEPQFLNINVDFNQIEKINLGSHVELTDIYNLSHPFFSVGNSLLYSGSYDSSFTISISLAGNKLDTLHGNLHCLPNIEIGVLNTQRNFEMHHIVCDCKGKNRNVLKECTCCNVFMDDLSYVKDNCSKNGCEVSNELIDRNKKKVKGDETPINKMLTYSSYLSKNVGKNGFLSRTKRNEYNYDYTMKKRTHNLRNIHKYAKQSEEGYLNDKNIDENKKLILKNYESKNEEYIKNNDAYDNNHNNICYETLYELRHTNENDHYDHHNKINKKDNNMITLNIIDGTIDSVGLFSNCLVNKIKGPVLNKSSNSIHIKVSIIGKNIIWFANNKLIYHHEFSTEMKEFVPLVKVSSPVWTKRINEFHDSKNVSLHMKFNEEEEKTFFTPLSNVFLKFENIHKMKYKNDYVNTHQNWNKNLWKPNCFVLSDSITTNIKKMIPFIIPQSPNKILIKYNHSEYELEQNSSFKNYFSNTMFFTPNIQIRSEPINYSYFAYCKNIQRDKWKFLSQENVCNIRNIPMKYYNGFMNLYNQSKINKLDMNVLNNLENKSAKKNILMHNIPNAKKSYAKILDTNTRKNASKEISNNYNNNDLNVQKNLNIVNINGDRKMHGKNSFDAASNFFLKNEIMSIEKAKKIVPGNINSKTSCYDLVDKNNKTHFTSYYQEFVPKNIAENHIHSNYINDYITTYNDNNLRVKHKFHNFPKIKKEYTHNIKYSSIQEVNISSHYNTESAYDKIKKKKKFN